MKLINTNELQQQINISPITLRRMEIEGLPFTKIKKSKQYNLEEVKAWISDMQRQIEKLKVGSRC